MRESKIKPDGKATLNYGGKDHEFPVYAGTQGPNVVDIRKLYDQVGIFTYDPGFTSTASTESNITFIDGDKGVLEYRGYSIADLAEHSSFLETCYLLLYGELPTQAQMERFTHSITHHTMVHEQLASFFSGFRRDAHPMAIMCGVVGALSAFYHDSTDINDPEQREIASHRLVAKLPTIAAMAYKYSYRPALRLSAEQTGLYREFPAHVLLGPGRGLCGQSGAGQGAGHDLHPARRS